MSIKNNLEQINEKIEKACEKSLRKRDDVKLVAVSKTVTDKEVMEAYECGQRDFAENRVQKFMEKYEVLYNLTDINWHIIGQLQTNKVKYCGDKVKLIHSIDRIEIARELSKFALKKNMTIHGLLEVNISGEESKTSMDLSLVDEFLEEFSKLPNISLDGVMTMAPLEAPEKDLHNIFAGARELSEKIKSQKIENAPMGELSMGMSGDYEIAIEEGATIVRVGTAIFLPFNF